MKRFVVTEYLEIDLDDNMWFCRICNQKLIEADRNYKEGCLVYARDPATLYDPVIENQRYRFSPDAEVCYFVEFYCPGCGTLIETEALPPGHPPTHDIELDLGMLRSNTCNTCDKSEGKNETGK